MRGYVEVDTIEMSIDDYAQLKRSLNEAEVKNALLNQQINLLKSEAFKTLGNLTMYMEEQHTIEAKKANDSKDLDQAGASKVLKERVELIGKRRHTTYVDSMVLKGLHSLVNEAD